jgi:hypothetical protein
LGRGANAVVAATWIAGEKQCFDGAYPHVHIDMLPTHHGVKDG